ncbi:MAG: GGDEF domain-containing protein [Lachnospiraceae bacterium]
MAMMTVYALLSLLGAINRAYAPYYGISLIYTVLVEILFLMPEHRNPKNVRKADIDIGSACAGMMFFGIVASIVDPSQVATSFLVMQPLATLFLNYSFGYLILFEFVYMLIFDISSYLVKAPTIVSEDVLNAFSFFLVSGFIAYFFHKEKIRNDLISNHYHFLAHIDSLTRILNHQYFFAEADRVLGSRNKGDLVFAVIDIDHFKEINDHFGHQTGDYCIRAVTTNMLWSLLHTAPESCADLIQVLFPEGVQAHIENPGISYKDFYDFGYDKFETAKAALGRIGGDEFAMLVGGPDPMDRVQQIEKSIHAIALPDGSSMTCSMGCVRITDNKSAMSVYKCADDALYEAKKGGRNRICTANA